MQPMKFLVTAGNTQTPLDRVRCITNIFTGQTGTRIAREAHARGHDLCLLTSHPNLADPSHHGGGAWDVRPFCTFDDLHSLMAQAIPAEEFDVIIHCAAVSDYRLEGVFAPADMTADGAISAGEDAASRSAPAAGIHFETTSGQRLIDVRAGKVKSSHRELWLRLVPTPKLVDRIRTDWRYRGTLVKFKLEVGVTEAELTRLASAARAQSEADVVVANTLEGMHDWALFLDRRNEPCRIERPHLARRLIDLVESLHAGRGGVSPARDGGPAFSSWFAGTAAVS